MAELWGMARRIKSVTSTTLVYEIDTVGGQSGAPVYIMRSGQRYVVGTRPGLLTVRTATDNGGWFHLDGLPEGAWVFRAIGQSGETLGETRVHVFASSLCEVPIVVRGAAASPARGKTTQDTVERKMKGNVRGRVRRRNGQPVAGAGITVVSGAGPAPDISPMTDDAGVFVLDELPAGRWVLKALGPAGESGEAEVEVVGGSVSDVLIDV